MGLVDTHIHTVFGGAGGQVNENVEKKNNITLTKREREMNHVR